MARMMALCSLPRSNPGNRIQYKRVNGPYTLYMTAGGGCKLPFGNFPRELNRIGVNLNQMARALNSGAVSAPAETQAAVERVGELVAKLLAGERE